MFQGTKFEKNVIDKKGNTKVLIPAVNQKMQLEAIPLLVCNAVTVTISFGEISDY